MGVAEPEWLEEDVGSLVAPAAEEGEWVDASGEWQPNAEKQCRQAKSEAGLRLPAVVSRQTGEGPELNEEQRRAVEAEGPIVATAPPGSGKTLVLRERVVRIMEKAAPQSIMCVTFTRYATGQMRDKIREVIGDAADSASITTLHACGLGVVRSEADFLGLQPDVMVAGPTYGARLLRDAAKDIGLDRRWDLEGVAEEIASAKARLLGPEDYGVFPGDFYSANLARVYTRYQWLLKERNLVDFGDILRLAVYALTHSREAAQWYRSMYRYVLVDEWQDTNSAQYCLVRALMGPETDLFVVGDPMQSIYRWRGADPQIFDRVQEDFPEAKAIQFRVNYRSTERIAAAAEGVVTALGHAPRDVQAQGGLGEPLRLIRCETDREEAVRVAEEIKRLAAGGDWRYNDGAVLVRTVRQARLLEQAFLRDGIPYSLGGQVPFFSRRSVKELVAWLRLAADPFAEGAVDGALNAPPRGLGKKTKELLRGGEFRLTIEELLSVAQREDVPSTKREAVAEFLSIVDDVHKRRELPALELLEYVLERSGYTEWLRKRRNGSGSGDVTTEVRDEMMVDLLSGSEEDGVENLRVMLKGYPGDEGLARFLKDVDEAQTDGEGSGVFLGTIHTAKGLEWRTVFLPGLDEGVLPHVKSVKDRGRLEEEHRLFYVGLTRAMQDVYLLSARQRMDHRGEVRECRPSRFLAFVPEDCVRVM